VGEAIRSVQSQTYQDVEIIVVNDASTDDTAEVLAQFAPQIVVHHHPENRGLPAARNTGILQRMVRGRTTFLITHRFTTAMRADVIYVLDEGQIIESGTHQQLLARNGHYAQSWQVQKQAEYLASQSEIKS